MIIDHHGAGRHGDGLIGAASRSITSYTRYTVFDDVRANVDGTVVTLTGKVTMGYKRGELQRRVAGIAGVRQVVDQLTVLPVSGFDDDLRQRIARAIYGNSNFWNYAIMPNPPALGVWESVPIIMPPGNA